MGHISTRNGSYYRVKCVILARKMRHIAKPFERYGFTLWFILSGKRIPFSQLCWAYDLALSL